MINKRPTSIAEYIRAAPHAGQPHLRQLYSILESIALHLLVPIEARFSPLPCKPPPAVSV